MDFYQQVGPMAIGSRLRRLSDRVTENATRIYDFYGIPMEPKWFPVFFVLNRNKGMSVTDIAQAIGHTHPSVSQIVKEMVRRGVAASDKSKEDGRVHLVRLTKKGRGMAERIEKQILDVSRAVEEMLADTEHNLWRAMDEFEYLLSTQSLYDRVVEKYKQREARAVEIVEYSPDLKPDFKRLNVEWIEKYFELEDEDLVQLDDPEGTLLKDGGHIVLARLDGEIVGTCALANRGAGLYELVKMAVTEKAQGKGIGRLLGEAVVEAARIRGGRRMFVESNTILGPAVGLYQKLGFKKVAGPTSKYKRCNIQMEMELV